MYILILEATQLYSSTLVQRERETIPEARGENMYTDSRLPPNCPTLPSAYHGNVGKVALPLGWSPIHTIAITD